MFRSSHLVLALPTVDIRALLEPYYGAESPLRFWAYALTLCVAMLLFRGTRRWGGIGFFCVAAALCCYLGLTAMMASVTPK